MMTLVWVLWALQLAGLSTMEYTTLWLISVIFVAVNTLFRSGLKALQEKAIQKEIEDCGDVKNEEVVAILLALILRKIATK